MDAQEPRPEQEDFGEASLGEGQSSNPPSDPEMLRDEGPPSGAGGERSAAEGGADDQDAEPPLSAEEVEQDAERDQAEG